jgi:hypothetical protein
MQQGLVLASFAEIEKGGGKFNLHSPIEKLGYGIIWFEMKIGSGNMMKTMQANPLFLFNQFIATNHTKPGK